MPAPCFCGDCRLCWLYVNDTSYRDLWDQEPSVPVMSPPRRHATVPAAVRGKLQTCRHRGRARRDPDGSPRKRSCAVG